MRVRRIVPRRARALSDVRRGGLGSRRLAAVQRATRARGRPAAAAGHRHLTDPRLAAALRAQLESRERALAAGAARVGWKLGVGKRERIGDGLVLGHLTSATRLDAGATFERGATALHADAEIAVRFERPAEPEDAWGAVGMFAIALELVDLGPGANAEEIVAANVFHRAFALGPANPEPPDGRARLLVGGEVRSSGPVPRDLPQRLAAAAGLLAGGRGGVGGRGGGDTGEHGPDPAPG